ncbi:MAG: right-handed parallel beta-helix repeat-containing protein [Sedimentisphaerales bacterium]
MHRIWLFLIPLCCTQFLQAQTLYVPSQHATIQSAINAATGGDTVVVSMGTYQENIDFKGKSITVRSADPNDPNVIASTIIDGSSPADSNFGSTVLFKSGEDHNSVLTGFTITGGTGSWCAISWDLHQIYWNRCGGGVLCYNMSAPTITKNVFTGNIAGEGGGVYIYGDPVDPNAPANPPIHISPVITGNTFYNNSAIVNHGFTPPNTTYTANEHGDGGAIVCFQGVDANITGNLIQNNHADSYGGGIHLRQWSNSIVAQNEIIDNNSQLGGGIHLTYTSRPTIKENFIAGNSASSLGGGGIYVYYLSEPNIERNTITDNSSANGAAICVYYTSAGVIRDNLIYQNRSGYAIRVVSSTPAIGGNTITNNEKGGIDCSPFANSEIANNIIANNGTGWGIWVEPNALPVIKYNDIWNNAKGTTGPAIPDQTGINGNISVDPNFVNADANDYHLDPNSPCINAGDPNYTPEPNETDYYGAPRVMFQRIDIGAVELGIIWNTRTGIKYDTIQRAVTAAVNGDVIVIPPGTYTGTGNCDILFKGKAITVQSIDPDNWDIVAATIVDSNGSDLQMHRGFYFYSGEGPNSVIAGLTITRGGGVYDGGAVCCYSNSGPTIKNCLITNNSSDGRGAIYCGSSSPVITNCVFTGNIVVEGYGAGVCAMYTANPVITNCTFIDNHAYGTGRHGGGIMCWDHSNAYIANCLIAANTAGHRGGGIAAYWSYPTYLNCTIIGNESLEGGGISSFRQSNPLVINCIIRDNIAPDGNQIALISTSRVWQPPYLPTEMTVMFSDIEGGQAQATVDAGCTLHWGAGNIDIDPCFVDPGHWDINNPEDPNDDFFVPGNYHLLRDSPCVDVGDNNSIPSFLTTDIDGEERIFNGTVDMGSDEMVAYPADLDGDGIIGYQDISLLAGEWLMRGAQLHADLNADGIVNFADFAELAEHWLWTAGWRQ